ncbi:exonuclease [Pseudomonas phage DL62]|uniref:Exonuclease n=1 Tax=Pseudomonas phage DL62 TaxID=1640972 RepID=A0A0F6YQ31_9CAUD|nr:DNA polymerase exonuclease subunit [Pseudomonas phage DL62]AKF13944.1 exonuclease [Pseudomonas phage DL62]
MSKLRKQFTNEYLRNVYVELGLKKGAEHLTEHSRFGEVSRQCFRNWCIKLGFHGSRTRGMYAKKGAMHWLGRKAAEVVRKFPGAVGNVVGQGPKVLSLDIETSPIEGWVWSLWKQNVGLNQIKRDWTILSFCAKWMHSDEVIYMDCQGDPLDDMHLLVALHKLLDEADIIIVQNGKRFDVPKINARFFLNKMPPPRPFKVIDTLIIAKQQFAFTSRKLEYMTHKACTIKKRLHGKFPGFDLWAACLQDNPEAWEEMRLYNIDDVRSMEELYILMRPWFVGHPNVAVYFNDAEPTIRCPKCGDTDVKQEGWVHTQTGKYEHYHCGGCGGWSRGRYTRNTSEQRKALLSN